MHWRSVGYSQLNHFLYKKQRDNEAEASTTLQSVQENHKLNCDKMSKGYLYVSESCCQIGVLQHTRAEECDRQDAELTKQAVVHGFRWDTERQPVSKDKVPSLTPASFLYTLWRPINQRREYPLYGNNIPVYALVFSTCSLLY